MTRIAHYTIDGNPVSATRLNAGNPRVYAIRISDGPVLGYVERTLLGRTDVYVGSAEPDAIGAQSLGSYLNMREAVEHVVREATNRNDPPVNPGKD